MNAETKRILESGDELPREERIVRSSNNRMIQDKKVNLPKEKKYEHYDRKL